MKAQCNNCGGDNHYSKEISAGGGLGSNLLPLGILTWLENPRYRLRVCGDCGLTQWFVENQFVAEIGEKFERELR